MERKHNRFVVFLDIDGVLNSSNTGESRPDGMAGIDYTRVSILQKAINENCGGDIVLTSDWKNMNPTDANYIYLITKLADYKLEISGKIDGVNSERGACIKKYLDEHPEIKEYVILDDNKYDIERYTELKERLLYTGVDGYCIGKGIENAHFVSSTPATDALLFMDCIKKFL